MLVKITGKENCEILTANSRDIAEDFEKEHSSVLKAIKGETRDGIHVSGLIDEILASGNAPAKYFIETTYENRGKTYPQFEMTRDGFSLLVMGFTGDKALQWKIKYISAFNEMENELHRIYTERRQWEIERAKGVVIRHILTDTIKMKIADSPNKRFAYPNYTKLIYKALFGKPLKDLQEEYHVKPKESIREYLTAEQLKDVESMEMLVSSLINCGWGYEQIKGFMETNHLKQLAG